jgi:sulfite reductase (NADPH) flavoprotein alpha-component
MPVGVSKITVAYGTESGNSKKIAMDLAGKAKTKGIQARLVSLDQYRLHDLSREEYFFTVISTQGEGEPPAAAKKFYEHIHLQEAALPNLKYAVLALGDTSYPLFCKAGEDVDAQLQKLGAQRIVSLKCCDTDFESDADRWVDEVLNRIAGVVSRAAVPAVAKPATGKKHYTGEVLSTVNLNDRGSAKHTQHIEFLAPGVEYQPGDSLGVIPENPLSAVESVMELSGADFDRKLEFRNEKISLRDLLHKKLNLFYLPERVVKKYAGIVRQEIPETRIGLPDLLKIYPVQEKAQFDEVLGILEPIVPRLYSIASSPVAHGEEVHLTVARDSFSVNEEIKYGVCSDLLLRLEPGQTLEFYVHRNGRFKLPAPDKDIIMVGPGTGIAPFRSFLAERDACNAPGRNWLFFGDQHFSTDFLYQTEIQQWLESGLLTRVDLAFSRDQENKRYVQHKMTKQGAELFRWLEGGAYLYVCGSKDPMSVDVEHALLDIIRVHGDRSSSGAENYLSELKESGRYLQDVY